MAVLVRTNREARLVSRALTGLRIPNVLHSTGDLFETPEAEEVERVLLAIAQPGREDLIRAALSTDLVGLTGEEIERTAAAEAEWENRVSRFRDDNERWLRDGFIRMFAEFLRREKVRGRLLSFPDGERRLTNVLHLAEVLHHESLRTGRSLPGLMKWFSARRGGEGGEPEEHQLRLESDEDAVRIVTVHKSKGLEYPIVFCPFLWEGSKLAKNEPFVFHDPGDGWQPTLVLNPEGHPRRADAEKEQLAEHLRLLYVALTRARNRCYVAWGRFRGAGTSGLAYLLHSVPGESHDLLDHLESRFEGMTDQDVRQDLDALAKRADGGILLASPSGDGGEPAASILGKGEEPHFTEFTGRIPRERGLASFSSLLSGRAERRGLPHGGGRRPPGPR